MIGPQWLESISATSGLDPLGVQAISIHIYGYLLPGMTNVTNRLRYYTFLCWALYNYSNTVQSKKLEDWQIYIRRAEFLFALIADMHHKGEKGSSTAMVGSATTRPVLHHENKETINIAEYTQFEYSKKRYFQNKGGGFSQYYQGPMNNLKLIVDGGPIKFQLADDVKENNELRFGLKAAQFFSKNKHLDLFHKCVLDGKVTVDQLKEMGGSLCACGIRKNKSEHALLRNLLFDLDKSFSASGDRRRRSLSLILNFIKNFGNKPLSIEDFRETCMYGYYPNNKKVKIHRLEQEIFQWWTLYQMHEYFAFALQCFFYIFERIIDKDNVDSEKVFKIIQKEVAAVSFSGTETLRRFKGLNLKENSGLSDFINKLSFSNEDESNWAHNGVSEFCLKKEFFKMIEKDKIGEMTLIAVIVLMKIYLKTKNLNNIYKNLDEVFLNRYRINMNYLTYTVEKHSKTQDSLWAFINIILKEFVVDWHAIVALRKFRYNKKSTLRYNLDGKRYVRVQSIGYDKPDFTSPRLSTAFRFLEDLGFITGTEDSKFILSQEGVSFLEKINEL
jgi:hypothetical protein